MLTQQLQESLYERIPLARAMGVAVLRADPEGVVLQAPFAARSNAMAREWVSSRGNSW